MQNQPWTGYKANKQTALPEKPNHPFWLMHHPMTCWELVQIEDDHFWLPTFRKLFDMPGWIPTKISVTFWWPYLQRNMDHTKSDW